MRALNRTRIVLLLATLAAAGCASRRTVALFGEPEGKQVLTIAITNNNFNDASVYLLSEGGSRRRLGSVTGKGNATFSVTWTNDSLIRLEVDFIAGSKCTTRSMMAAPGDALSLVLNLDTADSCDATR